MIVNFVCLYFWYLASKELNWIPTYASIQDPDSLNWPSAYYTFLDNTFVVGVFSSILLLIIFCTFFFKKEIVKIGLKIIGILTLLIFMCLLFGGFGDWWTD